MSFRLTSERDTVSSFSQIDERASERVLNLTLGQSNEWKRGPAPFIQTHCAVQPDGFYPYPYSVAASCTKTRDGPNSGQKGERGRLLREHGGVRLARMSVLMA